MALGGVVTNLPPSTTGWKGLENRSLDLLAPQPLQLMLKTGLLTLRSYSRFWDVLMNSRLGWQVTSWKEMLSIGGRLLNKPKEYFPRSEQQKYEREYHTIRQRDGETNGELMKRFLRLASFVGKKAGPPEERAKHFKWALYDWILDGIVNTEFTDVAQVASAARNMEILLMIDRVEIVIRSHGRTEACGQGLPKNGGNGDRGNGNNKQPAAKGQVFSLTKDQAANSSWSVWMHPSTIGDENPIRTLGDYSKPSHEGYRNTIELPAGNNVVPLRSDTIRLVQNGCSFHRLRSKDPNQYLKDFLKLVDSLDLDGSISTWEDLTTRFLAQFFPPGRTAKLHNDILMFQQHHGESLSEAWTHFNYLLQKVPHHGIDLWLQV
ncbi:zinc finger, CCHC-type containing protein [Tanacetum coccineum]